jgi:hypothetical protein
MRTIIYAGLFHKGKNLSPTLSFTARRTFRLGPRQQKKKLPASHKH